MSTVDYSNVFFYAYKANKERARRILSPRRRPLSRPGRWDWSAAGSWPAVDGGRSPASWWSRSAACSPRPGIATGVRGDDGARRDPSGCPSPERVRSSTRSTRAVATLP